MELEKVQDDKLYKPSKVADMEIFYNSEGDKADHFYILKLIKKGKLPSKDVSTGKVPRYLIKGADIKELFKQRSA